MPNRLTLLFVAAAALFAGPVFPADSGGMPLVFFIQQDIRPTVDRLYLAEGMQHLLSALPPDTPVRIYATQKNEYVRIDDGPAGRLAWPPAGFSLTVSSPATTPYRNLLHFVTAEELAGHTVVFITNGQSEDLYQLVDTEGFIQGAASFSPSRYAPLRELVKYCKSNQVRIIGLLVTGPNPRLNTDLVRVTNDAFNYGINDSGGRAYSNFTTFRSVFDSLLKSGLLRP